MKYLKQLNIQTNEGIMTFAAFNESQTSDELSNLLSTDELIEFEKYKEENAEEIEAEKAAIAKIIGDKTT